MLINFNKIVNGFVVSICIICCINLCGCKGSALLSSSGVSLEVIDEDTKVEIKKISPEDENDKKKIDATPTEISLSKDEENSSNNLQSELKTFFSPVLNAYNDMPGIKDGKSIFEKSLKIKETENNYDITISSSDLILEIYDRLSSISEESNKFAVSNLADEYKLKFSSKDSFKSYLTSVKDDVDNYVFDELEIVEGVKSYKYKSSDAPYKLYSVKEENGYNKFSDFKLVHTEFSELEIKGKDKASLSTKFKYNGKIYTLEQLHKLEDRFKKIEIVGDCFIYKDYMGKYRFNDISEAENTLQKSREDIVEENVKEKSLTLNFLGDKTELSYSDYGYWQENILLGTGEGSYELKELALPIIGGLESKIKEEKDLVGEITFRGEVIANIKELNKNAKTKIGTLVYKLDMNDNASKEFDVSFDDWYNIKINSRGERGVSNWEFDGDYEEKFSNGEGKIKELRYYGEEGKLESVGILEYLSPTNTHLTLTFGAKK